MNQGTPEQFRRLVSEGRRDHAVALLRWFDPSVAAEAFMSLPFEEQEGLFRTLPIDLAARLVESLPYYHAYVLLRLRPVDEVNAVLDSLNPFARTQFFEDLSGDAWRKLVEGPPQTPRATEDRASRTTGRSAIRAVSQGRAIIEARRIEKVFQRPDGGIVKVIAPLDLSLAAGIIVAVLGPSGSGKSTLLRILSGLTPPSSGEVFVTASGGAWNASIVAEYFRFQGRTLSTGGLGAIISQATDQGDFPVLLGATVLMSAIVVIVNRLVWRRLYALAATRFALEN